MLTKISVLKIDFFFKHVTNYYIFTFLDKMAQIVTEQGVDAYLLTTATVTS